MAIENKEMVLEVAGLGIIFHSPIFAEYIAEGEDYFTTHYSSPEQVQSHIQKGSIVGFGTGSPGTYILKFHFGYPAENSIQGCDYKLRLGLCCSGGKVCFRDLYEPLDWPGACPPVQMLELDDGYYHVTLCSNRPASGIVGDNQEIQVYLQKLEAFPPLAKDGIPTLVL